jgi:hypothetical protein
VTLLVLAQLYLPQHLNTRGAGMCCCTVTILGTLDVVKQPNATTEIAHASSEIRQGPKCQQVQAPAEPSYNVLCCCCRPQQTVKRWCRVWPAIHRMEALSFRRNCVIRWALSPLGIPLRSSLWLRAAPAWRADDTIVCSWFFRFGIGVVCSPGGERAMSFPANCDTWQAAACVTSRERRARCRQG